MILNTENKSYELTFSTRNIMRALDALGTRDIKEGMCKGMAATDPRPLVLFIQALVAGNPTAGELYDFLDDYRRENGCTIASLYADVLNELNENYFFDRKLTGAEMASLLETPYLANLGGMMEEAMKNVIGQYAAGSAMAPAT